MNMFEWVTISFVSVFGILLIVSEIRRAKKYTDNMDDFDFSDDDNDDMLW